MLKTFRVFARAVNPIGHTIGIAQNVKAVNVQTAIAAVRSESSEYGLSQVIISAVYEFKRGALMQEITLHEAAERAHQTEIICRLLEVYPNKITDADISALASLLARLSGSVASFLIEEESKLVGD